MTPTAEFLSTYNTFYQIIAWVSIPYIEKLFGALAVGLTGIFSEDIYYFDYVALFQIGVDA